MCVGVGCGWVAGWKWGGGGAGRKGSREGRRDRGIMLKTIQGIENNIIFKKIGKY